MTLQDGRKHVLFLLFYLINLLNILIFICIFIGWVLSADGL
ncbi:putative membrane protein [Raoultella ornithinolytica 2-156-04_S1_C2]|nr:putative membrane protein [Raoultella ornithinolytica 2-156-04_S1_C1]KDX12637.1 putative membrane protein [Raoultella ornithinolytica 2-156-04_S1_C2]